MRYKKYIILMLLFLLFMLSGCKDYYKYNIPLSSSFNTTNSVTLFHLGEIKKNELIKIQEDMDEILISLDRMFNVQDKRNGVVTDLMKVNENAGVKPVVVNQEVIYVLEVALEMSNLSVIDDVALYDPTILPIVDLWDITHHEYNPHFFGPIISNEDLPKVAEIEEALALVNYQDVVINQNESTVFLKKEGMRIDLGSIVKGYAADKLKDYLVGKGYTKAIIDVGRNVLTVGSFVNAEKKDTPFKIAIQKPYGLDNEHFGIALISDYTIVTSGIYQKYIMTESGETYHHIFDPRTGYPIENGIISITVICEKSILGDALSTTLFLLGMEKGIELINSLDYEVDSIWVMKNDNDFYEVFITKGLEGKFNFNEVLTEQNYIYKGVYDENS